MKTPIAVLISSTIEDLTRSGFKFARAQTFTERYPQGAWPNDPALGYPETEFYMLALDEIDKLKAEAATGRERIPVVLVPVAVTGADEYGLEDVVSPCQPCDHAVGHIYRFDDPTAVRDESETLTVWVDPAEYEEFARFAWSERPSFTKGPIGLGDLAVGMLIAELRQANSQLKESVAALEEKIAELRQIADMRQTEMRLQEMRIAEIRADRDEADKQLIAAGTLNHDLKQRVSDLLVRVADLQIENDKLVGLVATVYAERRK